MTARHAAPTDPDPLRGTATTYADLIAETQPGNGRHRCTCTVGLRDWRGGVGRPGTTDPDCPHHGKDRPA